MPIIIIVAIINLLTEVLKILFSGHENRIKATQAIKDIRVQSQQTKAPAQ